VGTGTGTDIGSGGIGTGTGTGNGIGTGTSTGTDIGTGTGTGTGTSIGTGTSTGTDTGTGSAVGADAGAAVGSTGGIVGITPMATTGGASALAAGTTTAPVVTGTYAGSVLLRPTAGFNGDTGAGDSSGNDNGNGLDFSSRRRRSQGTLVIDSESPDGLATGTLTLNGVGDFPVTGSVTKDAIVLIFQADTGAGALVLNPTNSGATGAGTTPAAGDPFNGGLYANLYQSTIHGRVTMTYQSSDVGTGSGTPVTPQSIFSTLPISHVRDDVLT